MRRIRPAFKLWLENEEGYVFGQGTYDLLKKIQEVGSLSEAAKALGISYRHAWGLIKRAESRMGEPLLRTHKGGRLGGGGAILTQAGRRLLEEFLRVRQALSQTCVDGLSSEGSHVTIGPGDEIEGEVLSVDRGDEAAMVKIRIDVPCVVTTSITRGAVEDNDIRRGDRVAAVVKATALIISKEAH